MANCNYHLMNDGFDMIEAELGEIASKIEALELNIDVDSLDIDLDNLELQLNIANRLHFLDAVGTNIMSEQEQEDAYLAIKDLIFQPIGIAQPIQDSEDEEP